ncbi:MAG: RNA 3'-terminal phosphate cyclase [Candidatus Aenigmatarchaeota archaeon]
MIKIDGSHGEGGGQIIRTATGLSAITGKPIHITNIRKGRCTPGLQAQHLQGMLACAQICDAKTKGAEIGSTEIEFHPNEIKKGNYTINIGTAGSIPLIFQTIVLPAVFSENHFEFTITGGTHVHWSPTMDYFQHIFCDFMKKMGIDINIEIKKHGFYPKGGGEVFAEVKPSKLKSIVLEDRGNLMYIDVSSIVTKDLQIAKVAERQINGFTSILRVTGHKNIDYVNSLSTGSSIHGHIHYTNCKLGSTAIGERGTIAEDVGIKCAQELKKSITSKACLDKHMADQILPYMALSALKNKDINKVFVEDITGHVKTNIWIIEQFLDVKFDIDEKNRIITCSKI